MFQYVSLALIAITAVIVLFNALKGLIRGFKKTIGSLVAIIISAVAAYILTGVICDPSSTLVTKLFDVISGLLGEGAIQELFGVEAIGDALSYYVTMIVAPIVFLALFLLISIVVSIIVSIIFKFLPFLKKKKGVVHRLGGFVMGILCGLLSALLILMPVVGVIGVAVEVGNSSAAEDSGDFAELADEASSDQIFAIYVKCCGWMYDSLASAEFEGEKVYLKKDIGVILSLVDNMEGLSGDAKQFGDEQINSLNNIIGSLDESLLLKHTVAEVLSELASKWVAGDSFIGLERIDAGELLNPVLDTILEVMSTSNKDNIVADMRTLTDMLDVFVKHDMLKNSGDYKAMLSTLSKDGVIKELMDVANANKRMSVLSDSITQLSIRALASTIGIPDDVNEEYNLLMDEIATALNESSHLGGAEKSEYVKAHVGDSLDKYGVVAEGEALDHITSSIISDLGDEPYVDAEAVSEFFTVYAIASSDTDMSTGVNGFDTLSASNFANGNVDVVISGDDIIVNGKVLKHYKASDYAKSQAYQMGKNHSDFGEASLLYSAQSMHSSLITLDQLLNNVKKYSDCADPNAETEKISNILSSAMEIFGQENDLDKKEMLSKVGDLLDQMSNTEIFGEDVTGDLLKAIFQSDSVKGEIGLSCKEINAFADKLNSTANSEHSSYKETTLAVSATIEVVEKINNKEATKEEKRESTEKLMSNMTPANAEILSTMTTPSMMEEYGTSAEKSEVVSRSVTTLFTNMANFQSSTESSSGDEEYAKEAEAVNTVLQLAMDGASSDSSELFAKEGNDGKTGYTAEEYVGLLVGSKVVSSTIIDTAENEGENPFGVNPSESDKEVLNSALVDYYNNNSEGLTEEEDADLIETLNAIAKISNMELPFGNN